MENRIRHEGIIEAVDGATARVRILQVSACAGCKIASHCHTSDSKEKIVDVDIAGRPQQCVSTGRLSLDFRLLGLEDNKVLS